MKRKFLSILLTLAMALTLLPTAAMAEETLSEGGESTPVEYVAQIGDVKYDTLAKAVAAANDGDTVTLLADVNTPETSYTISKSLTIDLKGKTVTGSGYDGVFSITGADAEVCIKNGAVVAVEGSGSAGKYTMAVWAHAAGCTVTLEALTVSQQITHTDDTQMDMIYASAGTIIINSGSFTSGTPKWTLNINDEAYKNHTANIIVNGGTFVKFDPSDSASENPHANFLAAGYGVKQDGDNYIVTEPVAAIGNAKYPTLADALKAADNTTVTLLKDTTEKVTIPTGKTITLDLNGKTLTHSGWLSVENGSDLILANGSINADIWVSGGKTAAQTTKLTIGSDVVLSGSFPIVVEGGTNLGTGKGTYGFSKVEIAGTVEATSSGVWVMGNLGNGTESMSKMAMDSNVIDILPTAKISGSSLGVTVMGLATVNIADGVEISGSEGIFVKRGTLNINGGTISGDRADFTLPPNANNNGSEDVGAALVISSTYNKFGTIDVNINGGTFTSAQGNAVYVGHTVDGNSTNAFVNGYQLDITAGSFKGAAGKDALNIATSIVGDNEACKTTVTGGLFSSDPSAYVPATHHVEDSFNGSYPFAVKVGSKTDATIIVTAATNATVSETIKTEDKAEINKVINNADVDGVATAIRDDKKAAIAKAAGVTDEQLAGKNVIETEITVKVEAKAADLAKGQLTFEASPEATVKVNGTVKGTAPVTNSMLNGKPITVKLPLPTVDGKLFTPNQILHKFTGGGYEYFINESVGSKRGAGSFKIEDGCAVFTIYGFSTFELSGTVTYVAPSSGGGSSSSSRRYDVSAPSVKHGDVTVSPKTASKGDTVTITVKPDSGYELDTLTVKDASGSKIKVKDKGDGKFTFTMPASKVTISAEFAEIETMDFVDVSTDAYYYEAVKWAAKKGITGGTGDGTFNPNGSCTRAHIVTFLWRAAGSPEPKSTVSFADVPADSYYAKAVAWAVENGITLGTGDGTFSPNATCTRAQSVTFLYRAMGTAPTTVNGFTDVTADAFYADAVAWAVESGVTNGTSASTFSPNNGCTRAQIVTFLYRTMK